MTRKLQNNLNLLDTRWTIFQQILLSKLDYVIPKTEFKQQIRHFQYLSKYFNQTVTIPRLNSIGKISTQNYVAHYAIRLIRIAECKFMLEIFYGLNRIVWSWSSLIEGDEVCIGPSVVFLTNRKKICNPCTAKFHTCLTVGLIQLVISF